MARYKHYDYGQMKMLPVSFDRQILPGTFEYTLDAKNRLTVPSKFRAALSDGVVLAKAVEPCVAIWTPQAYEAQTAAALPQIIDRLKDQGYEFATLPTE